MFAAYLAGGAARRIGQPRVVGEILVGIAAGPSLLGWVMPPQSGGGVSDDVRLFLFGLGKLGITLFLLLAGLRVDVGLLRGKGRAASLISGGALAIPLTLGTALGIAIYPAHGPAAVEPLRFGLFLGTVMAVSALPVLLRILVEQRMVATALGALAVACATVDDVAAWLLAAVVLAGAGGGASAALGLMGLAIVSVVLVVSIPLWRRLAAHWTAGDEMRLGEALPLLLAWGLLVAGMSESFGLHGGIGAFYAAVLFPIGHAARQQIVRWVEPLVGALLVPTFFVYAGAQTQFRAIDRWELVLLFVVFVAVAVVGKGGGAYVLARLGGLGWREAAGLAALLNARGVMGIILLTAGLESGLVPQGLFTLLVLTVLVTNIVVNPALAVFRPNPSLAALRDLR